MPNTSKKPISRSTFPRVSNENRISDLESYTSDIAAHVADIEERLVTFKSDSHKRLLKRLGDVESYVSDLKAHIAHLEVKIETIHKRLKKIPVPPLT